MKACPSPGAIIQYQNGIIDLRIEISRDVDDGGSSVPATGDEVAQGTQKIGIMSGGGSEGVFLLREPRLLTNSACELT